MPPLPTSSSQHCGLQRLWLVVVVVLPTAASLLSFVTLGHVIVRLETTTVVLQELRETIRLQGSDLVPLMSELARGLRNGCTPVDDHVPPAPRRRTKATAWSRSSSVFSHSGSVATRGPAGKGFRLPERRSKLHDSAPARPREPVRVADTIRANLTDEILDAAFACIRSKLADIDEDEPVKHEAADKCLDIEHTGLPLECANVSEYCYQQPHAKALQRLCPKTCDSCDQPCQDVDFTTFTEEDGRHSSCYDLRDQCRYAETSERVRRICPVTCGHCPGQVTKRPRIPVASLRNRTRAFERVLLKRTLEASPPMVGVECLTANPSASERERFAPGGGDREPWRIARILHQTWKTEAVPAKYSEELASWRRLHPCWRFEFWDDRRIRKLVSRHFPQYASLFNAMSGIKQADVARIVALHTYGGVYADIDVEAVRPFDDLLDSAAEARTGVLLGEENLVHTILLEKRFSARLVSNALMAGTSHHPFWREVLYEIFETASRCGNDPVLCTGPRLIDRLSFDHIRKWPGCVASGCVVRLPFDYFSPKIAHWNAGNMVRGCRNTNLLSRDKRHLAAMQNACYMLGGALRNPSALHSQRTFAVHHWQCSWCRNDDTLRLTVPLQEVAWRVGNETLSRITRTGSAQLVSSSNSRVIYHRGGL